jgi:hypothetical protein
LRSDETTGLPFQISFFCRNPDDPIAAASLPSRLRFLVESNLIGTGAKALGASDKFFKIRMLKDF